MTKRERPRSLFDREVSLTEPWKLILDETPPTWRYLLCNGQVVDVTGFNQMGARSALCDLFGDPPDFRIVGSIELVEDTFVVREAPVEVNE